jgi:hypothetical protein
MKKIYLLLAQLCCLFFAARAQQFDKDTILYSGDIAKHINFVVLGDGYTSTQLGVFHTHALAVTNDFMNTEPYNHYKNYFNVIGVKVISPESGVKHPRNLPDCPSAAEFPAANPNNYFGTSFDAGSVHRLVYPGNNALVGSVVADNFPGYDQILIIANTTQYGGAGGAYAVGTAHTSASTLMLHECGHSFVKLADEYWAGDGYAAEKINMTNQANASPGLVKWADWLGVSGTGIYQHCCGGISTQWYKPTTNNCMMEVLNKGFCPVCREAIIEKIHSLVNPIAAFTPVNLTVNVSAPMVFKLSELILPEPNTLNIKWTLNGNPIVANIDFVEITPAALTAGSNILVASVLDTTTLVRAASHATDHINKVTWNISADGTGININGKASRLVYNIFPNPANGLTALHGEGFKDQNSVSIRITDMSGKVVYLEQKPVQQGTLNCSINTTSFAAGQYIISVLSDGGEDQLKLQVVH